MPLSDFFGLGQAVRNLNATLDESRVAINKANRATDSWNQNGLMSFGPGWPSDQKTIDRGDFVQAVLAHYDSVFNSAPGPDCWHILVLYDQLRVLGSFRGLVGESGKVSDALSTEYPTAHLYLSVGFGSIRKYGYNVYVFQEGQIHNLGDGGWINWGMKSSTMVFERNDKMVKFTRARRHSR